MGLFGAWFETREQRQNDVRSYNAIVYPFGENQQLKIESILKELFKNEDLTCVKYNYLICRQEFNLSDLEYRIDKRDYDKLNVLTKKSFLTKNNAGLEKYLALVEADINISKELNYPSIEELLKRSKEIKEASLQ